MTDSSAPSASRTKPADSVVEALADALSGDESPDVRAEAALSLGAIADAHAARRPELAPVLVAALGDGHLLPRRAAAVALSPCVGEEGVADRLLELVRDAPELWREASTALGASDDPRVETELVAILGESPSSRSRRGAALALRSAGRAATAPPTSPLFVYADESGSHVLC
jgi:HEAT repeat protein